jgi:hypothetical protein
MIIAEERDDVLKIWRKELMGEKRLAELSARTKNGWSKKTSPYESFNKNTYRPFTR